MAESRDWTIQDLTEAVADPTRYAGGGAIAAMSLAGAAATIELVSALGARRKRVSGEDRERLDSLSNCARALRVEFLQLIDTDIDALETLMATQRGVRQTRNSGNEAQIDSATTEAMSAVREAIAIPLRASDLALDLLEKTVDTMHLAAPFTVSDLGAACATIRGAIVSMLLMAEVNIGLLSDHAERENLMASIEAILETAESLEATAVSSTRSRIRPEMKQAAE